MLTAKKRDLAIPEEISRYRLRLLHASLAQQQINANAKPANTHISPSVSPDMDYYHRLARRQRAVVFRRLGKRLCRYIYGVFKRLIVSIFIGNHDRHASIFEIKIKGRLIFAI